MTSWVAVGLGALDLRGSFPENPDADTAVTPIFPADPLVLTAVAGSLWRRLLSAPVDDNDLTDDEQWLIREFEKSGIANQDPGHPDRIRQIHLPWLSSFIHELGYALITKVAARNGIPLVFIKGPVQHAQGLRTREHSGDIEVWVRPSDRKQLAQAMIPWGWTPVVGLFTDTRATHSQTLLPDGWGCSIDVHVRFPGITVSDDAAFEYLLTNSEPWSFAGVDSLAPIPPANAVIRALHDLRPEPGQAANPYPADAAIQALQAGGIASIDVARQLGSATALHEALQLAFPDEPLDAPEPTRDSGWGSRTAVTRSHSHLQSLGGVHWRERPRALLRLVWPDPQVALAYEAARGRSTSSPTRARLSRLFDGIKEVVLRRPLGAPRERT